MDGISIALHGVYAQKHQKQMQQREVEEFFFFEGLWKIVAGDAVRELGLLYHRYKTYQIYEYHNKEVALNIVRIRPAGKNQQRIQAIGEGEMGQHITECAVSTRQRN